MTWFRLWNTQRKIIDTLEKLVSAKDMIIDAQRREILALSKLLVMRENDLSNLRKV